MKTSRIALLTVAACVSAYSLRAQQAAANPSTTTTSALHDLSELDKIPSTTKRVQPRYPVHLKAARVSGEALISFVVDVDGSVKNIHVEKASEPAFGEAALAAVAAWKFEPGTKNSTPVACQLSLPFKFAFRE